MSRPIYLDHAATTPCDPHVVEEMLPYLTGRFGNPSNVTHDYGKQASAAVERARDAVARLIGTSPRELHWTSGATESNNLAIRGLAETYRASHAGGGHIVTSATEHKAVLDPCKWLTRAGFEVTVVKPNAHGVITAQAITEVIRGDTFLVSVMSANNETGILNEVAAIGALCASKGIAFHCDAAQSVGKIPTDVRAMHVDLLSCSSHKIHGPMGVGALYVRKGQGLRLTPLVHGGGQESGLRSGTLNVPGIVGFGAAAQLAFERLEQDSARIRSLRERLENAILAIADRAVVNGRNAERLPGIASITFPFSSSRGLIEELTEIACSTGAACGTNDTALSHVLLALGIPRNAVRSTIRFSLGRGTTEEEVERAVAHVAEVAKRLTR